MMTTTTTTTTTLRSATRGLRGAHHGAHRRGSAMVLVMIAVGVALILATTFLSAQLGATGMAENLERRSRARAVAESGLAAVVAYVEEEGDWRSVQTEGTWVADQEFAGGGSFSVIGEDGEDLDGDGDVDGDHDFIDDESDPVTLTATGSFDGVTHTVRATVTSAPPERRLLLVVSDPGNLAENDRRRRAGFLAWGYDVALIADSESQADFDAAVAESDVAYISERCYSGNIGTKLRDATIGVVSEEGYLGDEFGIDSDPAESYVGTGIEVVDDGHPVTRSLPVGPHTITTAPGEKMRYFAGTLAPDARVLATRSDGWPALLALDTDGATCDGDWAAGRRVALPWGDDDWSWEGLTPDGLAIARDAIAWAAEPVFPGRVAHWRFDESGGGVAEDEVHGLDGILRNGVALGQSSLVHNGTAYGFDGADDLVEVPHDDLFLLDTGSISFWFRSDDASTTQGLVSKDSEDLDTGGHLSIALSAGKVSAELSSTTGSYLVLSDPIASNLWYHATFTWGPGGMQLYLDGALVASHSYAGGLGTTSGGSGNFEPFALGVLTSHSGDLTITGWDAPLSGRLDEVILFDRALTPSEIGRLSRRPAHAVRWREDV